MNEPQRFGSSDQEHFNAAYRSRPMLNLIVMALYACVFVFAIIGLIAIVSGQFIKGLGLFVLVGVAFACWAVIHNLALTNPHRCRNRGSPRHGVSRLGLLGTERDSLCCGDRSFVPA